MSTPATNPVVEVLEVRAQPDPRVEVARPGWLRWSRPRSARLPLYFCLDGPVAGERTEGYAFHVHGWIHSEGPRVESVRVRCSEWTMHRLPLRVPRPDVLARFPAAVGPKVGFSGYIATLGLPGDTDVVLEAELNDGQRVPVATLRIRPPALKPVARPGLLPLCKIGFGRSGTTWMMRLLREHPAIVVGGGFPYEVAALRHWSRLAHSLAQSSPTQLEGDRLFDWVRCDPRHHQELMETDAGRWLLSDDVEDGLSAVARRTESFYRLVALDQGRTGAVYFAEKTFSLLATRLAEQLYPGLGQILLVRDFRDVAASVNSFNARRGFLGVGRQFASSDVDHFRRQAEMVGQLLRYWRERKGRAVLVRYEDLVQNAHAVLERVFSHLGLDASPGLVAGVVERASREDDQTRSHRTTASPAASVGRWRRDLDPAQVRLIEDLMGEALEGFGYSLSARRAAA